jgi:hypothetical protein
MGLDQYGFAVHPNGKDGCDLAEWRKDYPLHEYMEQIWRERENPDPSECFTNVRIEPQDLDDLYDKIVWDSPAQSKPGSLCNPQTRGAVVNTYFTIEFIAKARFYLKQGYEIHYHSSY